MEVFQELLNPLQELLLVFWLFHGRMIADAGYPKAVRWAYGFGMCAAVYSLACTLPYYFIKFTGNGALLHQTELPSPLLIASAIYIIVFLCSSLADGTEYIGKIKKKYKDEQREAENGENAVMPEPGGMEPPSKADEIYNKIIKEQDKDK